MSSKKHNKKKIGQTVQSILMKALSAMLVDGPAPLLSFRSELEKELSPMIEFIKKSSMDQESQTVIEMRLEYVMMLVSKELRTRRAKESKNYQTGISESLDLCAHLLSDADTFAASRWGLVYGAVGRYLAQHKAKPLANVDFSNPILDRDLGRAYLLQAVDFFSDVCLNLPYTLPAYTRPHMSCLVFIQKYTEPDQHKLLILIQNVLINRVRLLFLFLKQFREAVELKLAQMFSGGQIMTPKRMLYTFMFKEIGVQLPKKKGDHVRVVANSTFLRGWIKRFNSFAAKQCNGALQNELALRLLWDVMWKYAGSIAKKFIKDKHIPST